VLNDIDILIDGGTVITMNEDRDLIENGVVAITGNRITAVLPMVQYSVDIGWDRYIDWCQRFLLILVLMVPFEIRDLKYDPPELRTIPQRIGVAATKRAGSLVALIYLVMTFLKDELHPLELLSHGILMVLLAITLALAGKGQSKYYASFWVEGVPILWGAMIWVIDFYWVYP